MSEQLLGTTIGALATIMTGGLSVLVKTWLVARRKRSTGLNPHRLGDRSPYGIQITSPGHGAVVAGTVEVSGTYAPQSRRVRCGL